MQLSSNTNQYQALQVQQKPVTLPVETTDPKYSNKEIYSASQGNVIRNEENKLSLTPQGHTNLNTAKDTATAQTASAEQAQKDAARSTATDYLAVSSKKSQAEIYLATATDDKSGTSNQTVDVINALRDVQKQNNAVAAYATYKEAQNSEFPSLY